jgi:hypothetical protein
MLIANKLPKGTTCIDGEELCENVDKQNLCITLPPSIERLSIQDCGEEMITYMKELASVRAERFPSLRSLVFNIEYDHFEKIQSLFEGDEHVRVERTEGNPKWEHYWLNE